jgi:hypothetical protein
VAGDCGRPVSWASQVTLTPYHTVTHPTHWST